MARTRIVLGSSVAALVIVTVALVAVWASGASGGPQSDSSHGDSLPAWQPITNDTDAVDALPSAPRQRWTATAESLFGPGYSGLHVDDSTDTVAVVTADVATGGSRRTRVARINPVTGERQWVSRQSYGDYAECILLQDGAVACVDTAGPDTPVGTGTRVVHLLDGNSGTEISSARIGPGLVDLYRAGSFFVVTQAASTDDPDRDITQSGFVQVFDSALNLRWSAQVDPVAQYSISESTGVLGVVASRRVEAFSVATGQILADVHTAAGEGKLALTGDGFAISAGIGSGSSTSTYDAHGARLATVNFWQLELGTVTGCDGLVVKQYSSGAADSYGRMDPATGAIVWRTTSHDAVECVDDTMIVPGPDEAAPSTFLSVSDGSPRGSIPIPRGRNYSDGSLLLVNPYQTGAGDPDMDQLLAYDWRHPVPVWDFKYRGSLRFTGRYLFGYDVDGTTVSLIVSG